MFLKRRDRATACFDSPRRTARTQSPRANLSLKRRWLRSPLKPRQIGIFPFRSGTPRGFLRLAEHSFGLFLPTLLLESFFSIALG